MESRPKPKDISWQRFAAYLVIMYAVLHLGYIIGQLISAPALAYDRKVKGYSTSQK